MQKKASVRFVFMKSRRSWGFKPEEILAVPSYKDSRDLISKEISVVWCSTNEIISFFFFSSFFVSIVGIKIKQGS
ncbi:hypothetical protein L1887_14157 [Cichorium endivia]|nr:hypothetical protein L1887_14157 [Cichorium endivia]